MFLNAFTGEPCPVCALSIRKWGSDMQTQACYCLWSGTSLMLQQLFCTAWMKGTLHDAKLQEEWDKDIFTEHLFNPTIPWPSFKGSCPSHYLCEVVKCRISLPLFLQMESMRCREGSWLIWVYIATQQQAGNRTEQRFLTFCPTLHPLVHTVFSSFSPCCHGRDTRISVLSFQC